MSEETEKKQLDEKRLIIWLSFVKFFLGTFTLGLIAVIINHQIQSREIELKEMQRLGEFVQHALEENIGVRLRFSQYFKTVTRSDKLRERWEEYYLLVNEEHEKTENKKESLLIELEKKSKEDGDQEKLNRIKKQIEILERELIVKRQVETYSKNSGVYVHIYWHQEHLTLEDAQLMKSILEKYDIKSVIMAHRDPNPPDSIFIGSLVNAEQARIVLSNVPYQIKYIFPLDYPRIQGGDPDGLLIGVGYMSTHAQSHRTKESTPIKISQSDIESIIEPGISNTEFQRRLRNLTSFN